MKESFVIYKAFYAPISELSDEDLGRLFRWLFTYQIYGQEPTNTDRVFMAFQFFKNQFRLDEEKYLKVVNRNKNNGLSGGRPKTQDNPKNPLGFEEPKKADKDKDKDKELTKVSKNPRKTSFEDSEIFDKHKFLESFPNWSKEKLSHYYDAALRYSVEGNKYVSWKLAVQTWAKKDELNKVNIEPKKEKRPYPMGLM